MISKPVAYVRQFDRNLWVLCVGWFVGALGFAAAIPFLSIYFHDKLGMSMTESALLGIPGTVLGVALGSLMLRWVILSQLPDTLPEVGLSVALSRDSIVQAAVLGIVALAAAPLFTFSRLRHMDVPGTLRVVE